MNLNPSGGAIKRNTQQQTMNSKIKTSCRQNENSRDVENSVNNKNSDGYSRGNIIRERSYQSNVDDYVENDFMDPYFATRNRGRCHFGR